MPEPRIERSATQHVEADPDSLFALVTDIDRLPEWNAGVRQVVERPPALVPGAEWVVQIAALGSKWNSRSTVEEIDPAARRFRYRSRSDDGNHSWAEWEWQIEPAGAGSSVTVSWDLNPRTFWRRVLLVKVRDRMLRTKEVPASIAALERALGSAPGQ